MAFEALCGQDHLKKLLLRAEAGEHLASAYLFHGEEGLGAGCAALELMRLLLCEAEEGKRPCGRCPGCFKSAALDHPDLNILFPLPSLPSGKAEDDPADHSAGAIREQLELLARDPWHAPKITGARQILVAQIRFLKKWAALRSYQGRYRVIVIYEAQAMGDQAQNALLKLLEEPPPQTILLLCADRPDNLLPTIVSRCQQVPLWPVPEEQLRAWMQSRPEALQLDAEALEHLLALSDGNPARARQLLEGSLPEAVADFIADAILQNPKAIVERMQAVEKIKDKEEAREVVQQWIRQCRSWLQDVRLLQQDPQAIDRVRYRNELERLKGFAAKMAVRNPDLLDQKMERQLRLIERNVQLYSVMITLMQDLREHITREAA